MRDSSKLSRTSAAPLSHAPAVTKQPEKSSPDLSAAVFNAPQIQVLQRTIGNQAVMRLMGIRRAAAAPRATVIQRKAFGLRDAANTTTFVDEGLKFWKDAANKDKELKAYSDFLMAKVNDILKALPSKEVKTAYSTSGIMGGFGRSTWTMTLNTSSFSKVAATTKVGQLTADEAAEIADTVYHEARHSEQFYKMAQVLAGDRKNTTPPMADDKISAELVKQLTMDKDAVDDAIKNSITSNATNADLVDTVREWEKIATGIHSKYKALVNDFIVFDKEPQKAQKLVAAVTSANKATTKTSLNTQFTGWEAKQLKDFEAELKRVTDMATKTAGDTTILGHVTKIVDLIKKVLKQWKDDTVQDETTIAKLSTPLTDLQTEAYQAYRDHLHEKDTWDTGMAAGKEFRTKAVPVPAGAKTP